MKVRNGEVIDVHNSSRKFGSASWYKFVRVRDFVTRAQMDLLFTSDELDTAACRALRNPEDLPGRSFAPTWLQWLAWCALIVLVFALGQCSAKAQLLQAPSCESVITFIDSDSNPGLPANLVYVFFSFPPEPCNPSCYVEGTRLLDANAPDGAWEIIQPTYTRRMYRQETNGAWFIGPKSRFVVIDTSEPSPIWFVRAKCFP